MLKLNLGCSDDHKPGHVNVDIAPPADVIADLRDRWPWDDSVVDAIYAHDVFEHQGKIHPMNEAWRVLKPGGVLDLAVPCVMLSDGRINPGAFADPTHCSFWTLDDRYYFCEEWNNPRDERGRLGPAYGIKAVFRIHVWKLIEYGEGAERRSKIVAILEAVKA
jgi:SAM-dependent methyltransferase